MAHKRLQTVEILHLPWARGKKPTSEFDTSCPEADKPGFSYGLEYLCRWIRQHFSAGDWSWGHGRCDQDHRAEQAARNRQVSRAVGCRLAPGRQGKRATAGKGDMNNVAKPEGFRSERTRAHCSPRPGEYLSRRYGPVGELSGLTACRPAFWVEVLS